MPHTIETTAYTFAELSDEAKDRAINRYREDLEFSDSVEYVLDDAKTIANLFGLSIDKIYYSGFCSQGDGACFTGSYHYQKGAVQAVTEYAPQDTELHQIVRALQDAQSQQFYKLRASIIHRGHYYHAGNMSISVYHYDDEYRAIDEESISEPLRDFAHWIYKQLEAEYDYQTSDECCIEGIEANGYSFTEQGKVL